LIPFQGVFCPQQLFATQSFLKRQLQGENFATLTQLRARLQQEFQHLTAEQVASMTSYDFILEALFYAAL